MTSFQTLEFRKTQFKKFHSSLCVHWTPDKGDVNETSRKNLNTLGNVNNNLNQWFCLEHHNASLTSGRWSYHLRATNTVSDKYFCKLCADELPHESSAELWRSKVHPNYMVLLRCDLFTHCNVEGCRTKLTQFSFCLCFLGCANTWATREHDFFSSFTVSWCISG